MPAGYHGTVFRSFQLAVLALGASVAQGETGPHPEIRQAILADFQYLLVVPEKGVDLIVPSLTRPLESDSELMVLPKFEVRSPRLPEGLAEAITRSRPDGPQNDSKLGTGIHEKDFGKVRAFVATVLYIPISIGFSW